ncbi:dihydrofolate reductase family protein [Streptomyces sp. NPDC057555]|uniref:dihydrofolate reductase family protein n=1 Tax=Streptomyces sp. NPDC057555 TaxID=3346166 RepID=UPI00368BCF48
MTAGLFLSLDGVAEAPDQWHFPYLNDEMAAVVQARMDDADTMLLGRTTYEEFAAYWPDSDEDLTDRMNGAHKLVVSRTLTTADWHNTTLLGGAEPLAELARLKQRPGRNIAAVGSIDLVRSLLAAGLLDELQLLVHPVVVGGGKRLFPEGGRIPLRLAASTTLRTGVLSLVYTPDDKPDRTPDDRPTG